MGFTGPSKAAVQALLIGVSEYPALDARFQLGDGPRNDVRAFERYLRGRGVAAEAISVLTEGSAAELPTRRAILEHLTALADATRPGDTVVLYFSGHGSQQPSHDEPRIEPDGLDEIILPRDVGQWDGVAGSVQNAIVDNEIAVFMQRFGEKGAFVWAIFDTCHSESMTRGGASPQAQVREVPPAELRVPESYRRTAPSSIESNVLSHSVASVAGASYVIFYAAQRAEVTEQRRLPQGLKKADLHGLFSYTLLEAITRYPHATYQQIIDVIHLRYRALNISAMTPGVEGPGADLPILAGMPSPSIEQWSARREGAHWIVDAGELQGVTVGSVLGVFPSPASSEGEISDYLRITKATATAAEGELESYGGKLLVKNERLEMGYVRPIDLKLDFSLSVGVVQGGAACELPGNQLTKAIDAIRRDPVAAQRIRWADGGESADVWLCQRGGAVQFLDSSANLSQSSAAQSHELQLPAARGTIQADGFSDFKRRFSETLHAIGKVTNVFRVAAAQPPLAHPLRVTVQRCRPAALPLAASGFGAQYADCDPEFTSSDPLIRRFRDGDILVVHMRNESFQNIDVTVLYVGSDYSIKSLFPYAGRDDDVRIPPDSKVLSIPIKVATDATVNERLLVIAVPAAPQSDKVSFESLAQEGQPRWRGVSPPRNSLQASLDEAAGGVDTQSHAGAQQNLAQFVVFSWTVAH